LEKEGNHADKRHHFTFLAGTEHRAAGEKKKGKKRELKKEKKEYRIDLHLPPVISRG